MPVRRILLVCAAFFIFKLWLTAHTDKLWAKLIIDGIYVTACIMLNLYIHTQLPLRWQQSRMKAIIATLVMSVVLAVALLRVSISVPYVGLALSCLTALAVNLPYLRRSHQLQAMRPFSGWKH